MKLMWGAETENKGWQGLNNAAINTFNSNVINSLVREMFQNSIDARNKLAGNSQIGDKPTKIKLRKFSIDKEQFPSYQEYREILDLVSNSGPNKKHRTFFNNAFNELDNKSKITLFGFEDYHTPGLSGDDNDPESSFSSCVLSEGTSINKDDTAGGSYGIGKNAIFGFSKTRTVFYSSLNPHDEFIFQGVAKLASFKDKNGKQYGYRIYCGKGNKQKSIRDIKELPSNCKNIFKRDDWGLSQYAVCPILRKGWQKAFIKAILRNYWMLLEEGELEVEIYDEGERIFFINSENLEKYLLKYFAPEEYAPEDIEPDGNPYDYYKAFKKSEPIIKEVDGLGTVQFHCLELEHQNTNRIAYLRNGMTIYTDSEWGFGSIGYCGVFYCSNQKGNSVLRLMEPPTHDAFEPEKLDERSEDFTFKDGEKILKKIKSIVREPLKKIKDKYKEPAEDIPWLDDLLKSMIGENNSGIGKRTGEKSEEETTQKLGRDIDMDVSFESKKGNTFINNKNDDNTDEGGGVDEGSGGGKRKGGKKTKNKNSKGGGPYGEQQTNKTNINSRIFITDKSEQIDSKKFKKYKVILESEEDLKPNDLMLSQQGDSGELVDYELGKVTDINGNKLNFKKNKNSKGEITSYVIEKVSIPNQLFIYVNEPYKSSFKIVKG
ncbi:hypothetical protein CK503_07160 [Aliifodinibius salipaludis]|uniref:Uncharacterized protein n=1 Tax=Fodinibius salipaludis TaxID=2032627 RepID=A0A2A2GCH6_9BACT|nr:hypothetical protein [Aliifodinibius salipaludis]PAU94565.1 hypothetical protein CK503_07160 [Aliifodinibius salipaludis]